MTDIPVSEAPLSEYLLPLRRRITIVSHSMYSNAEDAIGAERQGTIHDASGQDIDFDWDTLSLATVIRNRDFDMDSQLDGSEQTDTVPAAAGPTDGSNQRTAFFATHYAPGRQTEEKNGDDSIQIVGREPGGHLPTMDVQPDATSRGSVPATADNPSYRELQRTSLATYLQSYLPELTNHPSSVTDGLLRQAADPPEPSMTDEAILHNLAEIDGMIGLFEFFRGSIPERQTIYQEVISKLGIQRTQLHRRLFQSQKKRQQQSTVDDEGGHRFSSDLFPNASDALSMSDETRIAFGDRLPPTYLAATNPDPVGTLRGGYTHQVPPASEDVMQWKLNHDDTPQSVGISSAWPTESRKRLRSVKDVLDSIQSNLLLQPSSDPEPLDSNPEPLGSNPESPGSDSEPRMTKKVKMSACLRCRLQKRRCSGDGICRNCKEDKIQCVRPTWLDKNVFDYGSIYFLAFSFCR